jgi:hypothetical protein
MRPGTNILNQFKHKFHEFATNFNGNLVCVINFTNELVAIREIRVCFLHLCPDGNLK